MKSIIEEASSISKAIEQAWQRANRPQEFKIKIFEEPQKSIFGLTVRSAKIALFFNELGHREQKPEHSKHDKQKQPAQVKKPVPQEKEKVAPPAQKNQPSKKKVRVSWSDEMQKKAEDWITKNLALLNLSHISFESRIGGNNLYITFSGPVIENEQKERILFSSFAHLIMATLGNSFKKKYNNLKVVLKRA